MKKLITICFLLATAFTVKAQQKPSKEETMEYLKSVLIGQKGGDCDRSKENANLYTISELMLVGNDLQFQVMLQTLRNGNLGAQEKWPGDDELSTISLKKVLSFQFKTRRWEDARIINYNNNLMLHYSSGSREEKGYGIYCPAEHTEKVLKALYHLRDILPTKEQTLEWLNAKLSEIVNVSFPGSVTGRGRGKLYITANTMSAFVYQSSVTIDFDLIKDIYFKNNEIKIIGNDQSNKPSYISIEIGEELGNKYVKALKNMATLSGATLVKEDLFGN